MKLLTKDVIRKLPDLYSTECDDDPTVVVKFFTPDAGATWLVTEGSPLDSDGEVVERGSDAAVDWLFFGLCDLGLGFPELGYVRLSDLQSVRGKLGLPVERDRWFEPAPLSTARDAAGIR